MRGVQRAGELPDERNGPFRLQRSLATQQGREVDAVDEPHRDVEQPVGLARLVDGDDPGVFDRRGKTGLAQKPLAIRRVVGKRAQQQLQGDLAPEPEVLRAVHDPHPAAPEQRIDPVRADQRTDCG